MLPWPFIHGTTLWLVVLALSTAAGATLVWARQESLVLSRHALCCAGAVVLSLLAVPLGAGCSGDVATGTGTGAGTGTGGSTTTGTASSTGTGSAPTCAEVCPAVVAAGCKQGPPSVDSCETGCEVVSMSCAAAFTALLACGTASPTFICDEAGNPYPKGCEAEGAALFACVTK